MDQERQFRGIWIPKEIWLDNRLNALDKVILAEIDSLDNEETGCYASNKYLAEFCGCAEKTISRAFKKLKELNYIELINFNGRNRVAKMSRQHRQNVQAEWTKCPGSYIYNNIDNKIDKNKGKKKFMQREYTDLNKYLNKGE